MKIVKLFLVKRIWMTHPNGQCFGQHICTPPWLPKQGILATFTLGWTAKVPSNGVLIADNAPYRKKEMHRDWRAKLARISAPVLLVALWMTNALLAQSPTQTPPQPQPKSQQSQPSPTGETAKPETDKDNSAADKVYTDDDVEKLPPGGISVVGPPAPPPSAATSSGDSPARAALLNQGDKSAKAKAYWQARFAAARNKLGQDQKALPALQSQLETERVQQDLLSGDTTQVYSDEFMDLLNKIDALKLEIQNDKQALSDLHEEFRKAGGQPGWIR